MFQRQPETKTLDNNSSGENLKYYADENQLLSGEQTPDLIELTIAEDESEIAVGLAGLSVPQDKLRDLMRPFRHLLMAEPLPENLSKPTEKKLESRKPVQMIKPALL